MCKTRSMIGPHRAPSSFIVAKKELNVDLGQRLVHAHTKGKGYSDISKQHDIPVATVQGVINEPKRFNTVTTSVGAAGSGRCSSNLPVNFAERSRLTPEPQPRP